MCNTNPFSQHQLRVEMECHNTRLTLLKSVAHPAAHKHRSGLSLWRNIRAAYIPASRGCYSFCFPQGFLKMSASNLISMEGLGEREKPRRQLGVEDTHVNHIRPKQATFFWWLKVRYIVGHKSAFVLSCPPQPCCLNPFVNKNFNSVCPRGNSLTTIIRLISIPRQ